jgi:hypothetical protein
MTNELRQKFPLHFAQALLAAAFELPGFAAELRADPKYGLYKAPSRVAQLNAGNVVINRTDHIVCCPSGDPRWLIGR